MSSTVYYNEIIIKNDLNTCYVALLRKKLNGHMYLALTKICFVILYPTMHSGKCALNISFLNYYY